MFQKILSIALVSIMASPAYSMVGFSGKIKDGIYQVYNSDVSDVNIVVELFGEFFQFDFGEDRNHEVVLGRIESVKKDSSSGDWKITLKPMTLAEITATGLDMKGYGAINSGRLEKIVVSYDGGIISDPEAIVTMYGPNPNSKTDDRSYSGTVNKLRIEKPQMGLGGV